MVVDAFEKKGRMKLLASIGKEIDKHESALVKLRKTQIKLIKQCERGQYERELNALREELKQYRCGQ